MDKCNFRSIRENKDEMLPRYFATCALLEDLDGDADTIIDAGESKGDMPLKICQQCSVCQLQTENLLPLEVEVFEGFVMVKWYDLSQGRLLSREESAKLEEASI